MWPDRVSNPGPPTYESGALPIALRGPACYILLVYFRADLNFISSNSNIFLQMILRGDETVLVIGIFLT